MMQATSVQPQKTVRIIPATIDTKAAITQSYRQLRVAAYCRVSTKQDEQLNSYEVQRTHYEERIRTEPKWSLVGIFADKGITGTSMKKRDEFNKMLRLCYKGKIDMIIVKSISRFARNTLDVIKITRKLREINVDVYFEEQGIHSIDPASEFYITIYGSIAQSESENISANVKWGKAQSAKQGNVPFQCKHFLGYTKNADGEIEIVPEEAEIIREIYERYLSGESLYGIKCYLEEKGIPTPAGCSVWRQETIRSILSNEKYKGDAIINKTYVSDCISKRVKVNNGERNKYYIENNHPAIIDAGTFARVQEEIARRSGKPKVKQKGTKTELSRYSSKYALSELLICGECRTPYRRCTWTAKGKRKIVWRCINRLDYGKKYCHHSPSIEESLLQDAVMRAIMQTAKQNVEVLKTLKIHIGMGLTDEITEDKTLDIQIRIAEIDAEFQKMLKSVSADNADGIDEERITELMNEKQRLRGFAALIIQCSLRLKLSLICQSGSNAADLGSAFVCGDTDHILARQLLTYIARTAFGNRTIVFVQLTCQIESQAVSAAADRDSIGGIQLSRNRDIPHTGCVSIHGFTILRNRRQQPVVNFLPISIFLVMYCRRINYHLPCTVGKQELLPIFFPLFQYLAHDLRRRIHDVFCCWRPQISQVLSHYLHGDQVHRQQHGQETG